MAEDLNWDSRIGRRVRLRDLHILFAAANYGSMAKAGLHLGMTQSAVSQAIAVLEDALGVRLLDRTSRGVEPTIYGNVLLRRGLAAFDELRLGVKEIEVLSDPLAGEVRIACPELISAGILPPIIERMSQDYPNVIFRVLSTSNVIFEYAELRAREVDIALSRLNRPFMGAHTEDLEAEILFNDEICLAVGQASPWARLRKIDLADLVNEPWILPGSTALGEAAIIEAFRERGLSAPRIAVATFSVHMRHYLARGGRFIVALPTSILRANAKLFGLKQLPIQFPMPPWPVAVVAIKNRTLSPTVTLFLEHARRFAQSMIAGAPPPPIGRKKP
jgi:DNA-binding transcriptional LysR family regulator